MEKGSKRITIDQETFDMLESIAKDRGMSKKNAAETVRAALPGIIEEFKRRSEANSVDVTENTLERLSHFQNAKMLPKELQGSLDVIIEFFIAEKKAELIERISGI